MYIHIYLFLYRLYIYIDLYIYINLHLSTVNCSITISIHQCVFLPLSDNQGLRRGDRLVRWRLNGLAEPD